MNTFFKPILSGLVIFSIAASAMPSLAQDITITIKKEKPETPPSDTGNPPFEGKRSSVDCAILLDTSNSMDGLIDQARSQLWNIVQEFAKAKKNGQTPILRVAVFEYGNSGLPATEGYIRQVVQLTDDLDKVSEGLFGLKTNGGDEYCGAVIEEAIKRLAWSNEPNSFKAIFIAGNEPFNQGTVDYNDACKKAIEKGIAVNTIHCGSYHEGITGKWEHGAKLAEGKYLNIDQDEKVVHIQCPQDRIIIELNDELNKTYLWFGSNEEREELKKNQALQDSNSSSLGGLSSRVAAKGSSLYRNVGRDLVDTYNEDKMAITKLPSEQLPEAFQKLTPEQRLAKVAEMSQKRAEIKSKIARVNQERIEYIEAERKKMAAAEPSAAATLGDAFSETVVEQLQASGFEVEK
jgi:von Willebrand factor type A domain